VDLSHLAYFLIATFFVAHCREIFSQHYYHHVNRRSLPLFLTDPTMLLIAVVVFGGQLWGSAIGKAVLVGLAAEVPLHLVLFWFHFWRQPLTVRGSVIHNTVDAVLLGSALALVAGVSHAPQLILAVPAGLIGPYVAERLLGMTGPRPRAAANP
jgi:hypothetical protein